MEEHLKLVLLKVRKPNAIEKFERDDYNSVSKQKRLGRGVLKHVDPIP